MWLVAVALGAQIETTSSIGESCIEQHGWGALGHLFCSLNGPDFKVQKVRQAAQGRKAGTQLSCV